MDENPKRRLPAIPPELFNGPRPRAVLAAEKSVNDIANAVAVNHLLDLAATLKQRISEAIGLIDVGRVSQARTLLDAQVIALDALNMEPIRR